MGEQQHFEDQSAALEERVNEAWSLVDRLCAEAADRGWTDEYQQMIEAAEKDAYAAQDALGEHHGCVAKKPAHG